jgi:5-methylcytosine-specific restriction endonuclease McrA
MSAAGVEVITRAEAQAGELVKYFNGAPCSHGHVAERFVYNSRCVACASEGRYTAELAERRAIKLGRECQCCTTEQRRHFYAVAFLMGGEVDHIKPLALDGMHCRYNLQTLSKQAHREKTAREGGYIQRVVAVRRARGESGWGSVGVADPGYTTPENDVSPCMHADPCPGSTSTRGATSLYFRWLHQETNVTTKPAETPARPCATARTRIHRRAAHRPAFASSRVHAQRRMSRAGP